MRDAPARANAQCICERSSARLVTWVAGGEAGPRLTTIGGLGSWRPVAITGQSTVPRHVQCVAAGSGWSNVGYKCFCVPASAPNCNLPRSIRAVKMVVNNSLLIEKLRKHLVPGAIPLYLVGACRDFWLSLRVVKLWVSLMGTIRLLSGRGLQGSRRGVFKTPHVVGYVRRWSSYVVRTPRSV